MTQTAICCCRAYCTEEMKREEEEVGVDVEDKGGGKSEVSQLQQKTGRSERVSKRERKGRGTRGRRVEEEATATRNKDKGCDDDKIRELQLEERSGGRGGGEVALRSEAEGAMEQRDEGGLRER